MPRGSLDDDEYELPRSPTGEEDERGYEFGDDYRPRVKRAEPPREKPRLANQTGVLWVAWGGISLLAALAHVWVVDDGGMPPAYAPGGVCSTFFLLLTTVVCLVAGLRTLYGRPRSLAGFAVLSFVCGGSVVLARTLTGFAVGVEATGNPYGAALRAFAVSVLLMSGVLLAGVFALRVNGRYRAWRGTSDE